MTYGTRVQRVIVDHEDYETFDVYLINIKGTTTLASDCLNGTNSIAVTSATGAVVGEAVNIYCDCGHVMQTIVSSISGTTIGLATPTDRAFVAGSGIQFGAWNLAQNGSVTPVVSEFKPIGLKDYHILAITGSMTDNVAMDESTFGGITALTVPDYLYLDNSEDNRIFVVTNNAGFYEWGADTDYPAKVPSGSYSFRFRKRLLQINETGYFLNPLNGDSIKHLNRSDLSALTKYTIVIHGHIKS